jgi:hypothetical protein
MNDKIRPEFRYHNLNQTGIDACTEIREAFTTLLDKVEATVPTGRPRSLVTTKLQEACNWAVRAVAENPENQL